MPKRFSFKWMNEIFTLMTDITTRIIFLFNVYTDSVFFNYFISLLKRNENKEDVRVLKRKDLCG